MTLITSLVDFELVIVYAPVATYVSSQLSTEALWVLALSVYYS